MRMGMRMRVRVRMRVMMMVSVAIRIRNETVDDTNARQWLLDGHIRRGNRMGDRGVGATRPGMTVPATTTVSKVLTGKDRGVRIRRGHGRPR